jgi:AraC-like DNA-binding protein
MTSSSFGIEHTVPSGLILQILDVAQHWGVQPAEILARTGLDPQALPEENARIPLPTYLSVIDRARALTNEPGLGVCWGLQMRVSAYGYLGFATMSAATLREALDLVIQFGPLISTAMNLRLDVEGETAILTLDEYADFANVRDVVVVARLTGLWHTARTISGRDLSVTADVAFPEPAYHRRFAHLLPPTRFERPHNRAYFKASDLDVPLLMADKAALALARTQCETELASLSTGGRLVGTIRRLLLSGEGGVRPLAEVAKAVHMSPRTLRRKLALQGSSLSSLLGQERRNRAVSWLRSSDLSIEEMSDRLGYGSVQNFTRAFRQWTGATPAAFRRSSIARPAVR